MVAVLNIFPAIPQTIVIITEQAVQLVQPLGEMLQMLAAPLETKALAMILAAVLQ